VTYSDSNFANFSSNSNNLFVVGARLAPVAVNRTLANLNAVARKCALCNANPTNATHTTHAVATMNGTVLRTSTLVVAVVVVVRTTARAVSSSSSCVSSSFAESTPSVRALALVPRVPFVGAGDAVAARRPRPRLTDAGASCTGVALALRRRGGIVARAFDARRIHSCTHRVTAFLTLQMTDGKVFKTVKRARERERMDGWMLDRWMVRVSVKCV
jgi:hypothetical protein